MRVLVLHNRYRLQGGEERAVSDLAALLARRGHTVRVLERSSSQAHRARAAAGLLGGGLDPAGVGRAVDEIQADVVHAHNLHPLFGWRALAAARAAGARTLLHLHNFRLYCAIGVAYRDGAPCFRCHEGHTLPGLRLRCRGSLPEAAVYAVALRSQQPRLYEHADRFVTVSRATAGRLTELGLDGSRCAVLPNFVPDARFERTSRAGEGSYALVSGRLVEEKGFDTAIEAARRAGVPLVVVGSGPDEWRLRALASGGDVRFKGQVNPSELADIRRQAGVALVPSRSDEACPYAALDALAAGVPVLASDRGGLPELVGAGESLPAEDIEAWTGRLKALWSDSGRRQQLGVDALTRARERFSEGAYYERLMALYEEPRWRSAGGPESAADA